MKNISNLFIWHLKPNGKSLVFGFFLRLVEKLYYLQFINQKKMNHGKFDPNGADLVKKKK